MLVRTGQMHFLRAGDRRRYAMPSPGLSTSAIPWLRDHDVAAVATGPPSTSTTYAPATRAVIR